MYHIHRLRAILHTPSTSSLEFSQDQLLQTIVTQLNLISGSHQDSEIWWKTQVGVSRGWHVIMLSCHHIIIYHVITLSCHHVIMSYHSIHMLESYTAYI